MVKDYHTTRNCIKGLSTRKAERVTGLVGVVWDSSFRISDQLAVVQSCGPRDPQERPGWKERHICASPLADCLKRCSRKGISESPGSRERLGMTSHSG